MCKNYSQQGDGEEGRAIKLATGRNYMKIDHINAQSILGNKQEIDLLIGN